MARIKEFHLRDVRRFDGLQTARCGRITLLLGNNSVGKSTFLGCYKTLARIAALIDLDDSNHFDTSPFHLGSFDTIVRSGESSFSIGGTFESHCFTHATFSFDAGKEDMPREKHSRLEFNRDTETGQSIDIELMVDQDCLQFKTSDFCFSLARSHMPDVPISSWLSRYVRHGYLPFNGDPVTFRNLRASSGPQGDDAAFAKFVSFFRSSLPLPKQPMLPVQAFDPAKQEPRKRVYSSLPRYLDPACGANPDALNDIGRNLGLWEAIYARPSSTKNGSFEVMVETQNGSRNLVDVGYGVHSLLSLVHSIQRSEPGTVFLVQQPEVRIHPSAQAALAQFMAESKYEFLIETHSEHFTDRFRICVMDGTLRPDDLSIVYFDLSEDGRSAQIHNLRVDGDGNLLDVPLGFRSFFLEETKRLLGFQ